MVTLAFNWFREHCKWRAAVRIKDREQAVCTHKDHSLTHACAERICPVLHAPEASYYPDKEPIETLQSIQRRVDHNHETMFELVRCAACDGTGKVPIDSPLIDPYDRMFTFTHMPCPACQHERLRGYRLVRKKEP